MIAHALFDLLAAVSAATVTTIAYWWRFRESVTRIEEAGFGYAVALVAGAVIGGYAIGALNLWLSDIPVVGRSIVGALAGAIVAIELYKKRRGITGSTGLIFVPAFATSVAIGVGLLHGRAGGSHLRVANEASLGP